MNKDNSRKESLTFSNKLVDWYWNHGVTRTDEFKLNPARWLYQLYHSRESLEMVSRENNPRPASAIWGPSQTGKSTLIAGYVDGANKRTKEKHGALDWPDSPPAFFSLPRGQDPELFDQKKIVLNPYNGGMDASACITRFTKGTLDVQEGGSHIKDSKFPVTLKFSSLRENMLSIARGYDSQCDILKPDRSWSIKHLKQVAEQFGGRTKALNNQPKQEVYESAIDLCSVLEDLAISGLERYRRLLSPEKDFTEVRDIILQSNGLLSNSERFEDFRNEILWDGSKIISNFFSEIHDFHGEIVRKWNGKEVYCSLEATACFLDMDSYSMFSKNLPVNAKESSKETRVHRILSSLNSQEVDDSIFIGVEASGNQTLFKSACEFGIFQGLIQEVVIPLNMDNLDESPFKQYLAKYDLLDFPGVERGGRSTTASRVAIKSNSKNMEMPWDEMFCKVLKRGKTASLFQSYSKKMLIDSVSILQDLDNDKPNAQDIITGVNTWLKSTKPDYNPESKQKSPLPLNCVLTWWAKMLNESPSNSTTIFGKNKSKYEQLGFLADPDVANLYAINDFGLPRGKLNQDTKKILPSLLQTINEEEEFKRLFPNPNQPNSKVGFLNGEESGVDLFFSNLNSQMENSHMRISFWEKKAMEASVELEQLLTVKGLFPEKKSQEKERIKNLKIFRSILSRKLQSDNAQSKSETEQTLKYVLNVNPEELEEVPCKIDDINRSFLRRQFYSKGEILFTTDGKSKEVSWKRLGFSNEDQAQLSWNAICASIEPEMKEMVDWLRNMVVQRNKFQNLDFRRFLAVMMTNHLTSPSLRNGQHNSGDQAVISKLQNPILLACKERCDELIKKNVSGEKRKAQSGDDEIKAICSSLAVQPKEEI